MKLGSVKSSASRQCPFLTISGLLATLRMDIPVLQGGARGPLGRLSVSTNTWKLFLDQPWTGRLLFGELTVLLRLSKRTSSSHCYSEISPPCERKNRRSEEHTSELQSRVDLVCRLLLEKKKKK